MAENKGEARVWVRRAFLAALVVLLCSGPFWVYRAVRNPRKTIPLGTPLGGRAVVGVEESGFLGEEEFGGQPFRWTNGRGVLVVPSDPQAPPQALEVDIVVHRPRGALLQIFVNESKVFGDRVRAGELMKRFDISALKPGREVTIELVSDTFVPREETKGSTDGRTLGVNVRSVILTAQAVAPEK